MTYYPVFVEKEDWESSFYNGESRLVQICMSEEEAVKWIKNTDAKKIAELYHSYLQGFIDLVVQSVEEDTFDEHSQSREFFTEEFVNTFKNDDTHAYRYDVRCMKFDNEYGRSSIRRF